MASLSIVLVSTKCDWHGGEEQGRQLALGLQVRGHRVTVLAPAKSDMVRRMERDGVPVFSFAGRGRSPRDVWSIRRRLAKLGPDVVHFNDSHALTAGGLASLGLKIPARLVARRVDFALNSSLQYRLFADGVICVSHEVARICERGGVSAERLQVVHDGVDPRRTVGGDRRKGRRSLNLDDNCPLLLTVARLTDHKGHRFLLEAMPAVLAKYPHACLALAGDGDLRRDLQARAAQLGIPSRVRFLGYRDDVPDLLAACDLFVMPSHLEGLCSSLIDVMFAQRPIVATQAGGIPELVGRGPEGDEPVAHLVPPRDPAGLSHAICRALAAPAELAKMTQRALDRAQNCFTVDCMVEATLQVYRDALAGRAGSSPRKGHTRRAA